MKNFLILVRLQIPITSISKLNKILKYYYFIIIIVILYYNITNVGIERDISVVDFGWEL